MVKKISIFFFSFHFIIYAQTSAGAKQIALSNSDVALSKNVFYLFNNPSGLAKLKQREFGIFYSPSPFGVKELATGYFAYNEPTSFGNFTLGFMTYGFKLYKENQFQIGYAYNLKSNIHLGTAVYYKSVIIERYGSGGTFNISLGGIYDLTKFLSIGFVIKNPLRFVDKQIRSPLEYTFGTSYEVINKTYLLLAIQKELDFPFSFRFGIEYPVIKYFTLRFGVMNEPKIYSAGIGINYSYFKLDYAVTMHQELGLTHQVGIIVNFNSEIK